MVILSSGGLRSLVATALTVANGEKVRATLLHIVDGRDNPKTRQAYVRKQAEAYGITRTAQIELPHLHAGARLKADGDARTPLATPQMLLAAAAYARQHAGHRLVWPASSNGDAKAIARATERVLLCSHLCDLEGEGMPTIETPLLELTDQQIVELGAHLGVSWYVAWSCGERNDRPCRACGPCRRRAAAFERAGMLDPAATTGSRAVAAK